MKKIYLLLVLLLVAFKPAFGSVINNIGLDPTQKTSDPVSADLFNNGQKEVIYTQNGQVYAYDKNGIIPGFPWKHTYFNAASSLAIVDLYGDGNKYVIGGCYNKTAGNEVCVYDSHGVAPHGWPQKVSSYIGGAPAIADLDNNHQKEIIVATNMQVYIFNSDGKLRSNWPKTVEFTGRPGVIGMNGVSTSPVIADMDGDGALDIIVATTSGLINVWNKDGNLIHKYYGTYMLGTAPAVADLNQDGKNEIVFGDQTLNNSYNYVGNIYVYKKDGKLVWKKPIEGGLAHSSPVIGDLDKDGKLEIVATGSEGKVYVFKADGSLMPGWPKSIPGQIATSPVLLDIFQDKKLEIVVTAKDGNVYFWNYEGTLVPFQSGKNPMPNPMRILPQGNVLNSPVFGDFYGDGYLDIVAVAGNSIANWELPPYKTTLPWSTPGYDFQRTGYYSYKSNDAEIVIYNQQPKNGSVTLNDSVTLNVKVTNNGYDTWKSGYDVVTKKFNDNAYDCRPHLYASKGNLLKWDLYVATGLDKNKKYYGNDFGKDVKPGESVLMTLIIPTTGQNAALFKKGSSYRLGVDVVHETVAWFGQEVKSAAFTIK
ncbi:MAG: VCBS repeat-containing protein [Candidatus Omnitrophica bacterium]|nr:VCBS repeat-containing protein [Candidatus Omnitrophota bacterium]